jgi:hypothetical protein
VFLASIASFSLLITGYFSDVFDLRLLHRALFIGLASKKTSTLFSSACAAR